MAQVVTTTFVQRQSRRLAVPPTTRRDDRGESQSSQTTAGCDRTKFDTCGMRENPRRVVLVAHPKSSSLPPRHALVYPEKQLRRRWRVLSAFAQTWWHGGSVRYRSNKTTRRQSCSVLSTFHSARLTSANCLARLFDFSSFFFFPTAQHWARQPACA